MLLALTPMRSRGAGPGDVPATDAVRSARAMPSQPVSKYWEKARKELYKSTLEIDAQQKTEVARGLRYRKFMRGDPDRKEIAITFDDGPHPAYTPKLLQILKQYDAKATFFIVGEMAEKYPDLVRAELADGHEIANHTYHHVNLTKIPDSSVPIEIQACGDVLKGITGRRPHLFRPPGGDYDSQVVNSSESLGYTMVLWTDDPGDYASPGLRVIENRTLGKATKGGIILIHDGVQQTVEVLPMLLKTLKDKGFTFVTVDELMRHAPLRSP
jgi:peptidoglycan/xylan/chitin deacetylase (PgdA/CDA1 family)